MFKWFMTKTLITKIIIVTSSVVVIGGATAGAIIIPKQIEIKKEEQRQEQIRLENEEDLANISIELKTEKISIPYKGVTQGITIERYEKLDEAMPYEEGETLDKSKLTEVLKELFVESYTGGELTVDFDENINGYTKRGDYPITFTVTSEKGNTKSETAIIEVYNYVSVTLYVPEKDKIITKGTPVDIMEDVFFESNLPKEEQGHIETEGIVDVNTVGTYTITYTYIPKEGETEGVIGEGYGKGYKTRIFKVIEETKNPETTPNTIKVKLNTVYTMDMVENIGGELIFTSDTEYKFTTTYSHGERGSTVTGTYTINGNNVTLTNYYNGSINSVKDYIIDNTNNKIYYDIDYSELN